MLERQRLTDLVHDILNTNADTEMGVYNMCDENFDALSLPADDPKFNPQSNRIRAINVKCLNQQTTNIAPASNTPIMEDVITLQIVIFYASNHDGWARTLNEMCEFVQWTLEYGSDDRFRKFGTIVSRSTQIDDGTGYESVVREGGAVLEYQIQIREVPDAEWNPELDKFKKLANTFATENEEIKQTTNLPGPWPEKE